jgi:hypothetical protein
MGAYCPVSLADAPGFTDDVVDRIVRPTLAAMNARATPFTGLLYVGLMVTAAGPKVVEFNCRFGDPETEAVLPALAADASVFEAMATVARGGRLSEHSIAADRAAVTTVIAAAGYPEQPRTGDAIRLPPAEEACSSSPRNAAKRERRRRDSGGRRVLADWGRRDARGCTRAEPGLRPRRGIRRQAVPFDIAWRELRAVPELPETETIARDLDHEVAGRHRQRRSFGAPTSCGKLAGAVRPSSHGSDDRALLAARQARRDLAVDGRADRQQPRFTGALLIDDGTLAAAERRY